MIPDIRSSAPFVRHFLCCASATVCGQVVTGCRVIHRVQVIAEGRSIVIEACIIMEVP